MTQLRCGGGEQPLIGVRLGARERLGQSLHVVVGAKRSGSQQRFGVAVDELLAQLAGGGERGERDHHRADSRGREHPDDELDAVRVEQPHMGALAGPLCDQPAGKLRRAPVGLGIADAVAIADEERVVGAGAGLVPQDFGDREGVTGHGREGRRSR